MENEGLDFVNFLFYFRQYCFSYWEIGFSLRVCIYVGHRGLVGVIINSMEN